MAYSQGFSPHPRFHMAAALPLGFTSRCEVADIWLDEPLPIPQIGGGLASSRSARPDHRARRRSAPHLPALQTLVRTAEYEAVFPFEGTMEPGKKRTARARHPAIVEDFLSAESMIRERRGKMYDLRALVDTLELRPDGSPVPCAWPPAKAPRPAPKKSSPPWASIHPRRVSNAPV